MFTKSTHGKRRGFTMIEILLVVAGLAVLMGLGVNSGIKFMININTSDATTTQNTFIKATQQAIMQEAQLVKLGADSSLDATRKTNNTKFVSRLNEYLDGEFKILFYDGTTVPDGLTIDGLQAGSGYAGYYIARKDKWGMHYKIEFHVDDNRLTGKSYQTIASAGAAKPTAGYKKVADGLDATAVDTEVRIYIKSSGRNASTVAANFVSDNDDIIGMYQYVNAGFGDASVIRDSKESANPLLVTGNSVNEAFSVSALAVKPDTTVFTGSGDTTLPTCVINAASYTAEASNYRAWAILEAKGVTAG